MKGIKPFLSLDGISEQYLEEACAYSTRRRGRAKILRIVLPAAALIALLSVSLLIILPFAQAGGEPTDNQQLPVMQNDDISAIGGVSDPTIAPSEEPTIQPSEPTAQPTEPTAQPTEPTVQPTKPTVQPTEPSTAEPAESTTPAETPERTAIEDLCYEKFDDHVEITDYTGTEDTLVLPDTIDELPITKVEIPEETAEALSAIRFNDGNLVNVVVPVNTPIKLTVGKDVLVIDNSLLHNPGVYEFEVEAGNPNYTSFCGMLYNKNCTTLIACPAGYKTPAIDFDPKNNKRADQFTSYLAAQLQVISEKAFADCAGIKSIVLPQNLTSIGAKAFAGCSSLRALSVPAALTSIGAGVFERCLSLSYLRYDGDYEEFTGFGVTLPATTAVFYALKGDATAEESARIIALFEEAEKYCALFTRFSMIPVGKETSENGAKIVTEPGVTTKDDLTALLSAYFDEELKNAIVEAGFAAFYEEIDGTLYAYEKKVPAAYNEGRKDRQYAVTKTDDGYILTLRVTVPMLHTKAYVDCRYHIVEKDGALLFTDAFTLPAQAWYGLYLIESVL